MSEKNLVSEKGVEESLEFWRGIRRDQLLEIEALHRQVAIVSLMISNIMHSSAEMEVNQ